MDRLRIFWNSQCLSFSILCSRDFPSGLSSNLLTHPSIVSNLILNLPIKNLASVTVVFNFIISVDLILKIDSYSVLMFSSLSSTFLNIFVIVILASISDKSDNGISCGSVCVMCIAFCHL